MMTVSELLAEQRRCANRLYDEFYLTLWLAITKELNRRAEAETLDISNFGPLDFVSVTDPDSSLD